jgi:hypothetical protein
MSAAALGRRVGAAVAAALLCGSSTIDLAAPAAFDRAAAADGDRAAVCRVAEHRYRIVGKIRLALFWIGRDDVGGARMTWRSDARGTVLSLLAGSEPQRAPRSLNQWAYVREETRTQDANVFTLRSLNDDGSQPDGALDAGDGPLFGVSCASMTADRVTTAAATVTARHLTYRMFDRLLDRLAGAPLWKARQSDRPAGAEAGFLNALRRVIDIDERPGPPQARVRATYVYNGTVYELRVERRRPLGPTPVGSRTFDRLVRAELALRNQTSGEITKFAVTYVPGEPLPVQIFYQPSFWVSIELRLDDRADVPADPAADDAVLGRIRAICHAADGSGSAR